MEHIVVSLEPDILFHQTFPTEYFQTMGQEHNVSCTIARNRDALREAIPRADIFYGFRISGDIFEKAARLSWIHAPSAGVKGLMIPEVVDSAVSLSSSGGTMAPEVADHAMALLLAYARGIDLAVGARTRRKWDLLWNSRPLFGLEELTMGIIGYGKIGKAIGKRAKAFDMTVVGLCSREKQSDGIADEIVCIDDLDRILSLSDIVVIALPSTPQTDNLIGEKEFGIMKRECFLINIARGAIIDETAMVTALTDGRIAGAGLDVFSIEPLPNDSPLWTIPNVLITPHVGGVSRRLWKRMIDLFFENLDRRRKGLPLINVVDRSRGY